MRNAPLIFSTFAGALCVISWGVSASGQNSGRDERWSEDISSLSTALARYQIDSPKLYPHLQADIAELKLQVSRMTDAGIALEVMRLTATAGVAHNRVVVPNTTDLRRLPLAFHWYADGLAVIAAAPEYSSALGARVLRIGSMTPENMLTAISPWVPHENEPGLRMASTENMSSLELLRAAGVVGATTSADLTLVRPGGEPFSLTVRVGQPNEEMKWFAEGSGLPDGLLSCRHPDSFYWYEYLADQRTIYVQFNRCGNDPKLPFRRFAADLFTFLDSRPVSSVVLDLRFNAGGDTGVLDPLKDGLRKRPSLRSNVYVLVGPGTFSAAKDEALLLRQELRLFPAWSVVWRPVFSKAELAAPPTGAVLVGEPLGQKLNQYGNAKEVVLPHSKILVVCTTQFFRWVKDGDPLQLPPDLSAPLTLGDASEGRDAALEAALMRIEMQRH